MSEWYDKDDALTTARKRAKWDEDAAAIAQAQDRIAELEAALKPFADYFSPGMERASREHEITSSSPWAGRALTVGDLIRAKTALNGKK